MRASDDIRIEQRGGLVIVTLNRPRALNALSFDMCRALHDGLARWQADPAVGAVLIKGAGERAFCAGGDLRWLYEVLTGAGRRDRAGVLCARVRDERPAASFFQALCRAVGRHRHGRRRRGFGARLAPGGHRADRIRDARDRDRPLSGRRRDARAAAPARRARHVPWPHRRAAERRRLPMGADRLLSRPRGPARRAGGRTGPL